MAAGDSSHARRPQLITDQAPKDRKTIRNLLCTFHDKNTVWRPMPQVETNRQYQLDTILLLIKKGLVAPVHAVQTQFLYTTGLRPMGLTHNTRLAPYVHRDSGARSSCGRNVFPDGARGINFSGSTYHCLKRGNLLAKRPSGRFCLPTNSDSQKGWWVLPSGDLNRYILEEHFKMEGLHMVRN